MATSAFRSTTERPTPLPKSSTSGDDGESSSSARRSAPRRHRSLSRFSHRRMSDLDAEVTPAGKGKFVNTVRGSGFPEISLDSLASEFFDSFSADSSGISGGERGRSGSRKFGSGGGDGDSTVSQRRGRSVSRAAFGSGGGIVQRLTADTESSRRRRSVSRPPERGNDGDSGGGIGSTNSGRRRSVSRQPARGNAVDNGGGAGSGDSRRRRSLSRQPARVNSGDNGGVTVSGNSWRRRSLSRQRATVNSGDNGGGAVSGNSRRRSLSVVRCRLSDSESDVDRFQSSSNRGKLKTFMGGDGQITGSHVPAASVNRPSLRRSFSQNEIKYHDGYSSHSSAITDDDVKDTHPGKHGNERIIRAVYTQTKATAKARKSLGESDYGSHHTSSGPHHAIPLITKDYATKLHECEERKRDLLAEILLEEQRGKELSKIVKELLIESSSEVSQKPSRHRKRSKDKSRISTCLTDEAEKYIEEFISTIEDTDFSSLDDERSETSSNFGMIKTESCQSAAVPKCAPVETDGVMLPWLQWETSTDSSPPPYLSKSLHTTKSKIWESDSTKDATPRHDMNIHSISSRGSWSPCDSAAKSSNSGINGGQVSSSGLRTLKLDVADYLNRPSNVEFLYESWKLRNRISSGSLVLSSRLLM